MSETIRIPHPRSEASALLGIQSRAVLRELGWTVGFWTVSDEARAGDCIAALGRSRRKAWDVVRLAPRKRKAVTRKRTEDAETLARAGSWVYAFGSQFGSKRGPLQRERHFVARFNEALVEVKDGALRAELEVARRPFLLHRLVNDALREARIPLHGDGSARVRRTFVRPVRKAGMREEKRWAGLVAKRDVPINVEGATFLPGGHLLLGLRHPVTEDGHPILVELEGIDRYFEQRAGPPEVVAVRVVTSIGSRRAPAGVRELDSLGADIHLVTGNLDSKPEESALLQDDRTAASAPNEHWVVPLTLGAEGAVEIEGRRVRRFDDGASVEGLALMGERIWYAHDDEQIRLETTP